MIYQCIFWYTTDGTGHCR